MAREANRGVHVSTSAILARMPGRAREDVYSWVVRYQAGRMSRKLDILIRLALSFMAEGQIGAFAVRVGVQNQRQGARGHHRVLRRFFWTLARAASLLALRCADHVHEHHARVESRSKWGA